MSPWSAAESRLRPRAPSTSHIICTQHSTHPNTSRNGGLRDSSCGSVGPGGAVADCFTQLPLPAGFWGPGPSCFLAETVLPVGVLRDPMCPDPLNLVQPLNSPCSLSPLRAGREGLPNSISARQNPSSTLLSQHLKVSHSFFQAQWWHGRHQEGSEGSHWRWCDHPAVGL